MDLPLEGIITPLVTPLNHQMDLNIPGLEKLIDHQLSGGVHALFILGSTGEAPSLGYQLRKEFIKKCCELVNKRVPVLVGISDTVMETSIEISGFAKLCGADAVVVAPPFYYPLGEEEVIRYFEKLSPELALPFLLYNLPGHTNINLTVKAVSRCKELGAVGIKDSSGDMLYLYSLIEEFRDSPEFSIITGTEIFLPETIMNGGHGAVAGGANLFPKLFVDLYQALIEGDMETVSMLRNKVMMLYQTIYQVGKHPSRYLKATKCGLSVLGICEDHMAPPLHSFGQEEKKQIEDAMNQISLMR
ncbi:MAG: dihydrodipicolinate synthase family protein [Bacteroidota bacterium]